MTSLTYRYVAHTDVGLRRRENEDSGYASDHLLVIADGMGGAAAGEIASSETLHTIRQLDRDLDVDALAALEVAVGQANERLAQLIAADPAVEGMGTTLEALLWDGEKLAMAHVGDSRAYRLRDNQLEQISTDHTFVQSLVDEGKISVDEARVHPHRSLLLRAILGRDDNRADLSWIQPMAGDRYLLCSDGLSDMVPDHVIERALRSETIDVAATELVRLALEAGGYDNVTVVIAEFVDKASEPDPHLSCSDGQPQLVGAAAEQPRPRTGKGSASTDTHAFDPEELRYAPREPGRFPWLSRTLIIVGVLLLLGGVASYAYSWSQKQYFVSDDKGEVVVFRGVQADLPLLTLQHVERRTGIELEDLSTTERDTVVNGYSASSLNDALKFVLRLDVRTPTPTPSGPTDEPSEKPSDEPTSGSAEPADTPVVWRR